MQTMMLKVAPLWLAWIVAKTGVLGYFYNQFSGK
jgi:hypothetical protein